MGKRTPPVLVIGHGKMGNLYTKYIRELGKRWEVMDIKYGNMFLSSNYSHVIISTPTSTHAGIYRRVREVFAGPILIEKPVIDKMEDMSIFEDPLVYSGMCERHNPAIKFVDFFYRDKLKTADRIRFFRSSDKIESTYNGELIIHDLDLLSWLFGQKLDHLKADFMYDYPKYGRELSFSIGDLYIKVDLIDQSVTENGILMFSHPEPISIKSQLADFLGGNIVNAREAHDLMLRILQNPHTYNAEYSVCLYGD